MKNPLVKTLALQSLNDILTRRSNVQKPKLQKKIIKAVKNWRKKKWRFEKKERIIHPERITSHFMRFEIFFYIVWKQNRKLKQIIWQLQLHAKKELVKLIYKIFPKISILTKQYNTKLKIKFVPRECIIRADDLSKIND